MNPRIAKLEQDAPNQNLFATMSLEAQARITRAFLFAADENENPAMVEAAKRLLKADKEAWALYHDQGF